MAAAAPPTASPVGASTGAARSGRFHVLSHSRYLAGRTIRESLRQPGVEITNVFIPLFFLAVSTAAIGEVAGNAFNVDNYLGFQLPVAVLQAVAGSSSASGIAIVTDMERGYFDKLLLTPASRWSLIIGRVTADAVRAIFFSVIMVIAALAFGSGMMAGAGGVVVILLMAGIFGAAYSGIGIFVAMRTGNAQAAQASFLLFFPLLFMAPAFAPKEIFADWLQWIATVNPVTYMMEGIRELVIGDTEALRELTREMMSRGATPNAAQVREALGDGWSAERMLWAFVSLAGFAAVTLTMAVVALRRRAASG